MKRLPWAVSGPLPCVALASRFARSGIPAAQGPMVFAKGRGKFQQALASFKVYRVLQHGWPLPDDPMLRAGSTDRAGSLQVQEGRRESCRAYRRSGLPC